MRSVDFRGWELVKRPGKVGWEVKVVEFGKPDEYFPPHLFFNATDDESPARVYLYLKALAVYMDGVMPYVIYLEDLIYALEARVSALENP